MKYITCDKCGANLDHGELCDCNRDIRIASPISIKGKQTKESIIKRAEKCS